jgi:hypothetical protein
VITVSSSWSFKDSWATNITAIGAILGTVLTATGAVSALLPGVPADQFALLNVAWGVVVLVAPMLIAFHGVPKAGEEATPGVKVSKPTLFVASFVTLAGVGGEITTLAVLTHLSSASGGARECVYWALGVLASLTGLYAVFTTRDLVVTQPRIAAAEPGEAVTRPGGAVTQPAGEVRALMSISSGLSSLRDTSATL